MSKNVHNQKPNELFPIPNQKPNECFPQKRLSYAVMFPMLHVAIYAGVPAANHALKIIKETYAEMGVET